MSSPLSNPEPTFVASSEDKLHPPRPFFHEAQGSSDHEGIHGRPPRQPRGSASGHLRPQDRQGSSISIIPSGATTPANPFNTPPMEPMNTLSAPGSVISFSLGDPVITGDTQPKMNEINSVATSAADLQQRHLIPAREAFSSPRPRPLTVVYPAGALGTRSRLAKPKRPASTMLSGEITKPWVGKKDKAARISYFLTYSMLLVGIIGAGLRCYTGWRSVPMMGKLCLVMEDDFSGNDLDTSVWEREVDLGGFGWVVRPLILYRVLK